MSQTGEFRSLSAAVIQWSNLIPLLETAAEMTAVDELQTFRYLINPHGGFPQKPARFFHFSLHDEICGGNIIKLPPVPEKGPR